MTWADVSTAADAAPILFGALGAGWLIGAVTVALTAWYGRR